MSDQNASGHHNDPSSTGGSAFVVHGIDAVPRITHVSADDTAEQMLDALREQGFSIEPAATIAVADTDEEIDPDSALSVVVQDGAHLFVYQHACKRLHVDIRFGGASKSREFRASDTVGRVLSWAEREFEIVSAQRGQYRLKLPTANEYLDNDLMLGEVVNTEPCELRVDLVRAEQNAGAAAEMETLREHLQGISFRRGLANGAWSPACLDERIVTIRLSTGRQCSRLIGLRLDITGYPSVAPQGVFWDVFNDRRLPNENWPILPEGHQAFRPDWANGQGLYIACDRSALVPGTGHPEWATTLPYTNWRPEIGIARYLSVVSGLLKIASYRQAA